MKVCHFYQEVKKRSVSGIILLSKLRRNILILKNDVQVKEHNITTNGKCIEC